MLTLVGQRVFGIALGYEDLNDHDELRHDPMLAVLSGKLAACRKDCAPVAGKSTLNRLELSRLEPTRYHKITHDPTAIERLFVTCSWIRTRECRKRSSLISMPPTIRCTAIKRGGSSTAIRLLLLSAAVRVLRRHLLAAKLRPRTSMLGRRGRGSGAHRGADCRRWPLMRILLRADSGFARDALMAWCEANGVHFLFGLAKTDRLSAESKPNWSKRGAEPAYRPGGAALQGIHVDDAQQLEPPAPRHRQGGMDARRSQSSLHRHLAHACRLQRPLSLRTGLLRARRHGEPHQRVSDRSLRRSHLYRHHASQPTAAVVCLDGLCSAEGLAPHRLAPHDFAKASCGTIRLKLLKIGALVTISVRRITFAMASRVWQPIPGAALPSVSPLPPTRGPRPPDTRRRNA